jgi:hypothetical protein
MNHRHSVVEHSSTQGWAILSQERINSTLSSLLLRSPSTDALELDLVCLTSTNFSQRERKRTERGVSLYWTALINGER